MEMSSSIPASSIKPALPSPPSLARLIKPSLSIFEISLYTASWIFGVAYSICHVFWASRNYFRKLVVHDLEIGWFGVSKWRKDVSDSEWHVFSEVMFNAVPVLFIHFLGSQYLKKYNAILLPLFYFLLSGIYITKLIGFNAFLYLSLQPALLFLVHLLKMPLLVYVCATAYVILQDVGPLKALQDLAFGGGDGGNEDHRERYILSVTTSWVNARCISFCFDRLWREVPSSGSHFRDLLNLYAYCFYLPVVISGPILNYKEFHTGLTSKYTPWTRDRWQECLLNLMRYSFWFVFNNLLLHAFHFNALQYDLKIMSEVDLWTLCGVGYSMGQFFHLKYLVFYGMPRVFLLADNVPVPSPPKCIGRIHLYSDMWRYFDNGLYLFIHKYFYQPVINRLGKGIVPRLLASVVTFVFVYVWHGIQKQVLIWSLLNFLGITFEATARAIAATGNYQRIERSILSPRGRRRFYALLGAPLFMMSILSNFYFFMGVDLGHMFVWRSCLSWPIGTPLILFFMYCGAQTSYEMKNWEIRSQLFNKNAVSSAARNAAE